MNVICSAPVCCPGEPSSADALNNSCESDGSFDCRSFRTVEIEATHFFVETEQRGVDALIAGDQIGWQVVPQVGLREQPRDFLVGRGSTWSSRHPGICIGDQWIPTR